MCIIIDANVAHEFGSFPPHQDAEPAFNWLRKKKGHLALGGKISEELLNTSIRRFVLELLRNGGAISYNDDDIKREEIEVVDSGKCKSNDGHVIALARVSHARLLYSKDVNLTHDFKNAELLKKPRGKVYSSRQNKDLLSRCPPCRNL